MVAILIIQATLAMGKLCKIMKILRGLFIVSVTKAEVRALLDSTRMAESRWIPREKGREKTKVPIINRQTKSRKIRSRPFKISLNGSRKCSFHVQKITNKKNVIMCVRLSIYACMCERLGISNNMVNNKNKCMLYRNCKKVKLDLG